MRKSLLIVAAAGAAALSFGALQAQGGPPGQLNPALAQAGTYKTDKNHSLVSFRYMHLGFNDYIGLFGDIDATLTIDPANLSAAKVEATIPINPTVASPGFRDHLLRPGRDGGKPDFFGPDAAAAHFVSTGVMPNGQKATITGNLTLNGVTKPVTIEAEFTGAGNAPFGARALTLGFEGTATIKRSDFGLGMLVPLVDDEVELSITTAFEKQ